MSSHAAGTGTIVSCARDSPTEPRALPWRMGAEQIIQREHPKAPPLLHAFFQSCCHYQADWKSYFTAYAKWDNTIFGPKATLTGFAHGLFSHLTVRHWILAGFHLTRQLNHLASDILHAFLCSLPFQDFSLGMLLAGWSSWMAPFFFASHPSWLHSQEFLCKILWIPRRTNMELGNGAETGRELPVREMKLSRQDNLGFHGPPLYWKESVQQHDTETGTCGT